MILCIVITKYFPIEIIDDNTFSIHGRKTHLFCNRDATQN